jgi:plasmid rolling circle replication initiator protein Rep
MYNALEHQQQTGDASVGTSLEKFEESHIKKGPQCIICDLSPEQKEQINAGRERPRPISYETIAKWLRDEHNVTVADGTVRNHFLKGHHRV